MNPEPKRALERSGGALDLRAHGVQSSEGLPRLLRRNEQAHDQAGGQGQVEQVSTERPHAPSQERAKIGLLGSQGWDSENGGPPKVRAKQRERGACDPQRQQLEVLLSPRDDGPLSLRLALQDRGQGVLHRARGGEQGIGQDFQALHGLPDQVSRPRGDDPAQLETGCGSPLAEPVEIKDQVAAERSFGEPPRTERVRPEHFVDDQGQTKGREALEGGGVKHAPRWIVGVHHHDRANPPCGELLSAGQARPIELPVTQVAQ